jgi:hypothetical protein
VAFLCEEVEMSIESFKSVKDGKAQGALYCITPSDWTEQEGVLSCSLVTDFPSDTSILEVKLFQSSRPDLPVLNQMQFAEIIWTSSDEGGFSYLLNEEGVGLSLLFNSMNRPPFNLIVKIVVG